MAIMNELIDAIAYLHKNNIVHRDLKMANILVSSDLRLKISDFGFAKQK